jgi:diaminopimelate decarboxylase
LARRFGTPTFVYDAATIVERLADLQAFDVVRYAQKAASNLAILDLVRRRGALVDTVSAGEIRRAMAAGYAPQGDPPPIVYTADVFDGESLELVVRENVHVNCGSPDMIDQYGNLAPGRAITLRVNPGFGHGHSRKTNTGGDCAKHGIWHEQLAQSW